MFIKPVFETFGIALIAAGIMLMAFLHTPLALIAGLAIMLSGLTMIYRHYTQMGTNPDVLDYIPGSKGSS